MKRDSEYEYEFEIGFCALTIGPYTEWYAMKVTEPYFRSSSSAKYKHGKNKEARSIVSKKELLVPISVSNFIYGPRLPVAVLGSYMYCLCPMESNLPIGDRNQVWTLDLTSASSSNCWKPGPHMNFARSNPHVMVLDNKLYALGSRHPDFEADSSSCGWMEVFHPELGTWESLPNPPSRCFLQRIKFSAPLHDKKQIVVVEVDERVTYYIYNVETRRWATLDSPRGDVRSAQYKGCDGFPNEDTITTLAPAVVGNTLYWGFLDDQKFCLQAYNLDTDVWFYARLDLCSSVLWKGEVLPSQRSTSLHHLADHKFCFLFTSLGRGNFLNCLIFDVSPISRKNYHYHANDEDDDFSRNLYRYYWNKDPPFSKLGISIVSIHKYPVHGIFKVFHTVLLDAGFYTSKKKKPKLSRKPIESPTCRDAGFYTPKMKKPKSSHKP